VFSFSFIGVSPFWFLFGIWIFDIHFPVGWLNYIILFLLWISSAGGVIPAEV